MNTVKGIHLIPHIEGTYPLTCECDGSRLNLHHVFFNCNYYVVQRLPILDELSNNNFYDLVLTFLKDKNFIKEI